MKTYSSTVLKTFSNNCPQAMAFHEDGKPCDRTIYAAGITAHAIAEAVGNYQAGGKFMDENMLASICNKTAETLMSDGRAFNGVLEPPLPPESVFEGRDVALSYFTFNPFEPLSAEYEAGYGMTTTGEPCNYYDDKCRYRAAIDVVYFDLFGDESAAYNAAYVRDYKTAWSTDETQLETLQRKGQAVLTWLHNPDVDMLVLEIINMRTGQPFTKEIMLDENNLSMLAGWRDDILLLCDAADKTKAARAGAGCIGCSWALSCPDCLDYAKQGKEATATAFATLEALRAEYIKVLKPMCADSNMKVHAGYVGFKPSSKKIVTQGAAKILADYWYMSDSEPHDAEIGLLSALQMGSTNIEKMAKQLCPNKKDVMYTDIMQRCIEVKQTTRFGAHKG